MAHRPYPRSGNCPLGLTIPSQEALETWVQVWGQPPVLPCVPGLSWGQTPVPAMPRDSPCPCAWVRMESRTSPALVPWTPVPPSGVSFFVCCCWGVWQQSFLVHSSQPALRIAGCSSEVLLNGEESRLLGPHQRSS